MVLAVRLLGLGLMFAVLGCDGAAEGVSRGEAARTSESALRAGRIDVGYALGSPDALVVVVEFSDFGCPYCGQFARATFPDLHREYIDAGLVRWRYVPVIFGFAGGGVMGAAAECAGQLGGVDGFWRAHRALYRNQTALRGADAPSRVLSLLAAEGFDRRRLDACLRDPATAAALDANYQVAKEWGVEGTPTFLVNGAVLSGARPTQLFRLVLDDALAP